MRTEMGEDTMLPCQIRLFGAFDVQVDGAVIPPLRSRKVQWLLALLILRHGQALDRAWLAGTLWPESDHSQALYNLRKSLSNLRAALGKTGLCFHASMVHTVSLDLHSATVDVLAFDAAVEAGDRSALEQAASLYRAPLLEGCTEEWVFAERRSREEIYLNALERLAAMFLAERESNRAVNYLRAVIQVDPLREQAQRALIEALAAAGDYGAAVQAYRELRLVLRRDLNTDPDPQTLALFQQIRDKARTHVRRPAPSPLPQTSPPRQLPSPLTALVGRRTEVERIVASLRDARLLTLTGSGGVGKTRLSIAVAEVVAPEYPDGVFFVDLAPLSDPILLIPTVAAVMQVGEEAKRPLFTTLRDYLHSKTLLLILDNCEHLLDDCARLTDTLLRECPGICVLATSRQTLGLTGEIGWTVPPLSTPALPLPAPETHDSPEAWLSQLGAYESVQLLVVRAQQVLPSFRMSAQNAGTVAQICVHLDGIPLALELAAARVRSLPLEEIHKKLDNRFRLLTGGSRTALPRQQTLRALIDWSYDLLNSAEKTLLGRLSVFAGGWTLQAAEQICAGGDAETAELLEDWEILDLLTGLADKSLVIYENQAGEARYRLLETVRQYARDRLTESGEADLWRRAHCDYFLREAEEAEAKLKGPEQNRWLQGVENEHDNLRAALDFCLVSPEGAEAGLRIAGALQQFWWTRGYLSEGRTRLIAALARPEAQGPTPARAWALSGAGSLAWMQGDYTNARTLYTESLALQRALKDQPGIAGSLHNLGNVAVRSGDYATARTLFEESLMIKREIGDRRGVANTLVSLSAMAFEQGDYTEAYARSKESVALAREQNDQRSIARSVVTLGIVAMELDDCVTAGPLFAEGLALHRELGDVRGIARTLHNQGSLALRQGDYATSRPLFEECLVLGRELGDRGGIAHALGNLGYLLGKQADYPAARACLHECLVICRELGETWLIAYALELCAELNSRLRRPERSVRLYSAADALRATKGCPLPPASQAEHKRNVAAERETIGTEAFTIVWAEGQTLIPEQALSHALESLGEV